MADKLTHKERSAFDRALEHNELLLILFGKVKKLCWFDVFQEEGLLRPENNIQPCKTEDGYVSVPNWPIITYLVNSSVALQDEKNLEYARKYLNLIKDVTKHAKDNEYSNYRTWWKFSQILENIPPQIIQEKDLDVIDYWLDDKFESGLIVEQIGEKWLVSLLSSNDDHSLCLSRKILSILYQVTIVEDNPFGCESKNALFKFDKYHAQNITNKVAKIPGEKLGEDAIFIFDEQLKKVLKGLNNDTWSSLWHPAIECHEQNEFRDEAKNILVQSYRDSLDGFIEMDVKKAGEHIKKMLGDDYQTIHRLAIHCISNNYSVFNNFTDGLLNENFFSHNYRHEMWHFLHKNYKKFSTKQKNKTLKMIGNISINDGDNFYHKEATAYNKVCWLHAIKSYGGKEEDLYEENISIAKTDEPDHPDFSSYMSSSSMVTRESPFSIDELGGLSIGDLVEKLNKYENPDIWKEPSVSGLCEMFNQLIKSDPSKFYLELDECDNLDLPYINEIIRAYSDLWKEKTYLPWDDVWKKLLKFFEVITNKSDFWNNENNQQSDSSVDNRRQIISGISKIVEVGANPGDSALIPIEDAKKIILHLLSKETGSKFNVSENAVSIAINSPRGQCLGALINLAFRSCRLADKKNNNDHSGAWAGFQSIFDAELDRAYAENPEYEFITLVANWSPHFLYMSKEWTLSKLDKIFDQSSDLKWACAMQGYAYANTIYPEIYQHLATHGDFIKALEIEDVIGLVKQKVVENIAIVFLSGSDDSDNETNLMDILIERKNHEEINRLIWFILTLREDNEKFQKKVFSIWDKISTNIKFSTDSGKKIASQLCGWAEFINKIEGQQQTWLLEIAPYAETNHKGHQLLKNLLRLSEKQPYESQKIWLKMLDQYSYAYPEDTIKKFLKNLVNCGEEGEIRAKDVASKYLKHGEPQPVKWLNEVIAGNNNSRPHRNRTADGGD